jgi:putative aldouronate transport system substrate-binding protein
MADAEEDYLISKKPLTMTIFQNQGPSRIFSDDWPVFKEVAKLTNISLKGTASEAQTDQSIAFNTMISSRPLPDIVVSTVDRINQYGLEGAFVPLDDLIEEHAPNLKKFYEDHPEKRKQALAPDGKLYMITHMEEMPLRKVWWIRQDWLDKLGLDVPTTVDELYNVAKAFREQDPNGNGEQDEVPFFCRFRDGGHQDNLPRKLLNLFGVKMQSELPFYVDDNDGTIKYSYMSPEFKPGMSAIAKWYAEGLIDQEYYSRSKPRATLLSNDQGGITNDYFGSTSTFNIQLAETIPGFQLAIIKPPQDVHGKVWDSTGVSVGYFDGWGISIDNKNPVETLKYFDFWFSDKGKEFSTWGIEGLSWEEKDGKKQYTEEFLRGDQPLNAKLIGIGANQNQGHYILLEYYQNWVTEDIFSRIMQLIEEVDFIPPFPNLPLTPDQLKRSNELRAAIDTYGNEMIQKWVMNAEPVEESYDAFEKEVKRLGLDELLEIYNEAYQRYLTF